MYKSIVKARLMRRGHDGKTISFSPSYLHSPIYLFLFVCCSVGKGCFSPHRDYVLIMYKRHLPSYRSFGSQQIGTATTPLPSRLIQFFSFLKSSTLRISLIWSLLSSANCSIGPSILTISHYVGALVGQLVDHTFARLTTTTTTTTTPIAIEQIHFQQELSFFKIVNR